jgi:aspartate/tyrosine/aromatic aminotransferase
LLFLESAPEDGLFFLLQPCAHNPAEVDPTEEHWRGILYRF